MFFSFETGILSEAYLTASCGYNVLLVVFYFIGDVWFTCGSSEDSDSLYLKDSKISNKKHPHQPTSILLQEGAALEILHKRRQSNFSSSY